MNKQQYSLITKKFAKNIWRKYIKAIEEYRLFSDGDRIYVPKDGTAAGQLMRILLQMTAEFKMYDIIIVEENYNKIARAQVFQDIMDNTLWELLYNGRIHSMLPKENKENIVLIRPLYLIRRENIEEWVAEAGIEVQENEINDDKTEQLLYIRQLIKQLSENNEAVENNVFGSVTNVDADMLMGYNQKGEHHEFLEWY